MGTGTRQILALGATLAVASGLGGAATRGTSIGPVATWAGLTFVSTYLLGGGPEAPPRARFALYGALFLVAWVLSPPAVPPSDGALAVGVLGLAGLVVLGLWEAWPGRKVAWRWAVWIAALGVLVALFSGGRGSPGGFVQWLVATLGFDEASARLVAVALRKTAHVGFYATFAWSALRYAATVSGVGPGAWQFALLWVAGHAAFDELRQAESPLRTGSVADFALDMAGAGLAVAATARRGRT